MTMTKQKEVIGKTSGKQGNRDNEETGNYGSFNDSAVVDG